jgi:hypothetical protein
MSLVRVAGHRTRGLADAGPRGSEESPEPRRVRPGGLRVRLPEGSTRALAGDAAGTGTVSSVGAQRFARQRAASRGWAGMMRIGLIRPAAQGSAPVGRRRFDGGAGGTPNASLSDRNSTPSPDGIVARAFDDSELPITPVRHRSRRPRCCRQHRLSVQRRNVCLSGCLSPASRRRRSGRWLDAQLPTQSRQISNCRRARWRLPD